MNVFSKSPPTSLQGLDHSPKTPWTVLSYPLFPASSKASGPSRLDLFLVFKYLYHIQPQNEGSSFLEGPVGPCWQVESDF